MDFALMSDNELRNYVKQEDLLGALNELSNLHLLDLHYELTQVPSRTPLPVPMIIIKAKQERGLNQQENREIYGEYAPGK